MIDSDDQRRIDELYENADDCLNQDEFDKAVQLYQQALEIIPNPKEEWAQSTAIYTAIGEAEFYKGDSITALKSFQQAMKCPGGVDNPLLQLRLGQAFYELFRFDEASDHLARAFMLSGDDLFQHDDPKYLRFLKTRIDIE